MANSNYDDEMAGKKAEQEMIRVRVTQELRERWEKFTDARGITTQRALIALLDFIMNEDELTQAMILRQVPEGDFAALSEIVLKRLAERKAAAKPGKKKS